MGLIDQLAQITNAAKEIPSDAGSAEDSEARAPSGYQWQNLDPRNEEKWLARIKKRFEESQAARRHNEAHWYEQLSFYIGEQYVGVDERLGILIPPGEVPDHRVQQTVNKIRPAVNNLVALETRAMPTLSCAPATEDPEDYDRARMATQTLRSEWNRAELTLLDHGVKLTKTITGTAGVWSRWNQALGPWAQRGVPRGEIENLLVSPFCMYPDPDGVSYAKMRYFIHCDEMNVDELKKAFPQAAHLLAPAKDEGGKTERYKSNLRSLLSVDGREKRESRTLPLRVYWEPRSQDFPFGVMAIATDKALLWIGDNPWAEWYADWVPIDIFRHYYLPDSFWGGSPVGDAIPIQKALNKAVSQRAEYDNLMAKGRYWWPDDCEGPDEPMTGEPGEIIEYHPSPTPPYMPQREDLPPPPTELASVIEMYGHQIEDLFHWHETSQGKVPKNIQSGYSIELLQEKDELSAAPINVRDQLAWVKVGKRILRLARDHWDDERTISAVGKDYLPTVMTFRGMQLPENVDIIIESDHLLPTTKLARAQTIRDMVMAGMLLPEDGLRATLMGFNRLEYALKELTLDEEKQHRENRMLEQGVLPEPAAYDDHVIHKRVLTAARKTPAYEAIKDFPVPNYPGMTIDDLFEAHGQGHSALQLEQEMALAMLSAPTEPGEEAEESAPGQTGTSQPSQAEATQLAGTRE